jgi:hypothetical protein
MLFDDLADGEGAIFCFLEGFASFVFGMDVKGDGWGFESRKWARKRGRKALGEYP